MRNQCTIKNPVNLTGVGIHSGREVRMSLQPADPDTGVVFVRSDLEGEPRIPARHDTALKRQRQTVLRSGPVEVSTVEHFMSALFALSIDNIQVILDGPEVPAADGSALKFVELLEDAGRVEQKRPRKEFVLDEPVVVADGGHSIVALPYSDGLKITYTLDYSGQSAMPPQHVTIDLNRDVYLSEIAAARTFCLEAEIQQLQEAGFGKGADASNTLVVGTDGVVGNELRFEDEFARHKVLDLVGDLSLLGADLKAHIMATKSGHSANVEMVGQLHQRLEDLENQGFIQRDTGLDVREIMKIVPHRYPFLFLDRVIEVEGYRRAVAIKNVSFNEPHFQGHWPDQPIMPGVLQVEALAQLAGVLFLRRLENTGKIAVLMSIDKIKLRRPVVPGDQLRLECETLNLRNKSGKVFGRGSVNGEMTVSAILKFMLIDS